jgi:lipase chaperone LimK
VPNPLPGAGPNAMAQQAQAPLAAGAAVPTRADSLRGSDVDGDWSHLDTHGRLQPALALRQRFDHLHTQLGERGLAQIEAQLAALMTEAGLSAAHASQVLALHTRYLELLQWRWQVTADRLQPHTWAAAVAERQRVRRQLLGLDWAEAFYAADDALWQAAMEGSPPATPDAPPHHPDAQAREAALAARWRDWDARLAAARQAAQQLAQDASLSPQQRDASLQRYLAQHFKVDELPRVQALLANPGP